MEKEEKAKAMVGIFTFLVRVTVSKTFRFPQGGSHTRTVESCVERLEKYHSGRFGKVNAVDFCVKQVYTLSGFSSDYLETKWATSHSFGKKAVERYTCQKYGARYYEDAWLSGYSYSRQQVCDFFADRRLYPLKKHLFPEYEENTKRRLINTEMGFYLCLASTLLWNVYSAACVACRFVAECQKVLAERYPELYRLRMEEAQQRTGHGS